MTIPPRTRLKHGAQGVAAIVVLYAVLLIPAPSPEVPSADGEEPFQWNQDALWLVLEERFKNARALGCDGVRAEIVNGLHLLERVIEDVATGLVSPDAPQLDTIEATTFALGPLVAACHERLADYTRLVTRIRSVVKRQSQGWTPEAGRDRLYRLLFGGRGALEEVMLQGSPDSVPDLVRGDDEPSAAPSAQILGVTVHSGDLLVSRGGEAISSLIAVGNDYQGNFSHAALVHVDDRTNVATVVHSNRDRGLHVQSLEEYLEDVELRVMILRVRRDLPALARDSLLPHGAATLAMQRARETRTPYDFRIDHEDHSAMYCTEVVAWAYQQVGIDLQMDFAQVSAPGVRAWLADLGVTRFDLEEPSDLEYDPQLRVVAEWRDPHALYDDHVDNVVTEAMLDGASRGERLGYDWFRLPIIRLLKGYSVVVNALGRPGPVPEGVSATVAARILALNAEHARLKADVLERADEFQRREGYRPPEWQLVRLARLAHNELHYLTGP